MACLMALLSSPVNGSLPVTSSNKVTPNAHMSTPESLGTMVVGSTAFLKTMSTGGNARISGAMYSTVPTGEIAVSW